MLRYPGGKVEAAPLAFGRFLIRYKELSPPVAGFKVMLLCRELIYVNTFLGLDLWLKDQNKHMSKFEIFVKTWLTLMSALSVSCKEVQW